MIPLKKITLTILAVGLGLAFLNGPAGFAAGDKTPPPGYKHGQGSGNTPAGEGGNQNQPPAQPRTPTGTIWDQVPEGGYIRSEGGGKWTILDKNMNPIGTYPPPEGQPTAGVETQPPPGPPPLPPVVTPTQGGGTMTSTQNADGTWGHHYHREDSDGNVVDYDIKPEDEGYPHDDPRFWKQNEAGGGRVVTTLPGGGTITSTRNPDGSWRHQYHRDSPEGYSVDYELKPDSDLYPHNDPRFRNPNQPAPDPFGGGTGMNAPGQTLGRDIQQGEFAGAPHPDQENS